MRATSAMALAVALALPASARAQPRPDAPGGVDLLFEYDAGDVVETLNAGPVTVHFTRTGPNGVSETDADGNGVPDFAEEVAAQYTEALAFYESEGFAPPRADTAGGGPEFDVYVLDLFGGANGSFQRDGCDASGCWGYMVHENDFAGSGYTDLSIANRIVGSHELFHAIQAAYASGIGTVFSEGTATWATERFDGSLRDFENAIRGYLSDPERPLDLESAGAIDRFAYGSALFFRFLEERYGPEMVRSLVEAHEGDGGSFLVPLDALLRAEGTSFAEAFVEHTQWNLRTSRRWSSGTGYTNEAAYAPVTPREVTLPLEVERPRLFHAAARYYRTEAGSRETVAAALVGEDVDAVVLYGAVDDGDELRLIEAVDGSLELTDTAGTTVWLVVVHPALEGPSARTSICAGDPAEVIACTEALTPPMEDAGPPPMDGGVSADAGTDAGDGGGCSATGASGGGWLTLLALALLGRRRRR